MFKWSSDSWHESDLTEQKVYRGERARESEGGFSELLKYLLEIYRTIFIQLHHFFILCWSWWGKYSVNLLANSSTVLGLQSAKYVCIGCVLRLFVTLCGSF